MQRLQHLRRSTELEPLEPLEPIGALEWVRFIAESIRWRNYRRVHGFEPLELPADGSRVGHVDGGVHVVFTARFTRLGLAVDVQCGRRRRHLAQIQRFLQRRQRMQRT